MKRLIVMGGVGGYTKTLNLAGTGADQTDYILPILVHQGVSRGSASGRDVFLDGKCAADFSDVRFTDANGVPLSYYRAGYGNYEFIPDSTLQKNNWIHSNGMIVAQSPTYTIVRSADNGANWTTIYNTGATTILGVDSRGYLYIASVSAFKVYRSTNWTTGNTFAEVLDLSATSAVEDAKNLTEDSAGNLYLGIYQAATNPRVYKSTDDGATWAEIFGFTTCTARPRNTAVAAGAIVRPAAPNSHLYYCTIAGTTEDAADDGTHPTWPTTANATVADGGVTWKEMTIQHCHGCHVDLNTDYIYCGMDGASPKIIRSIDAGVTWAVIRDAFDGDVTTIYTPVGARFFAAGWSGEQIGSAVFKTTDDAAFAVSLQAGLIIQGLNILNGTLYASAVIGQKSRHAQILRSIDSGATWTTAWIGPYDKTVASFMGYFDVRNTGIPTGETETQLIFGPTSTDLTYLPLRAYEGGNHNQAVFYVKVPSLPDVGTTIKVTYGLPKVTTSDITIFSNKVASPVPVHRYRFNEGAGTTITDTGSAATPRNGVLTAGGGSWVAASGRVEGPFWPQILQAGSCYSFSTSLVVLTDSKADATFNLLNNWTVLCWIKGAVGAGLAGSIFCKGYPSSATGYYSLNANSSANLMGNLLWYVKGAGGSTIVVASPAISWNDGQLHLVGICADGTATAKVSFIMDTRKSAYQTVTNGNQAWDAAYEVRLGRNQDLSKSLLAQMCEVQFYDHELTQPEIQAVYEDRPVGTVESVIT